jgi:hypothetical protein
VLGGLPCWRHPRCQRCRRRTALTYCGWCPACVQACCGDGDGPRVGLPVPVDLDHAVQQLDQHLRHDRYQPRTCWTCALLSAHCTECDTSLPDMAPQELADHGVVDRWIVVGCEDYATAALRAAAIHLP